MRRKRVARRYRYKYQNNRIRPRIGKKLVLATTASVLAVAVAGTSLWNFLRTAAPVEAQESFSGIKKVVENHSEGEPFVILDIVPGTASYAYTLSDHTQTIYISDASLGTMGYLTDGQIPAQESLRATFKEYQEAFYSYAERAALASALLPAGMDTSLFRINYKEGYAGVTPDLSKENGWIQIYDSYFPDSSTTGKIRQTGITHATVQQYVEGDTTGFDYNLASGSFVTDTLVDGDVGEWAGMDGAYHATFAYSAEPALQGYRVKDYWKLPGDFPLSTSVYLLQDGVFQWVGSINDISIDEDKEEDADGEDSDNNVMDETPGDEVQTPPVTDAGTEPTPDNGDDENNNFTEEDGDENGDSGNDAPDEGDGDSGDNTTGEGNGDSGDNTTGEGNGDSGDNTTGEDSGDSGDNNPDEDNEGSDDNTSGEGDGDNEDSGDNTPDEGGDIQDEGNDDGGSEETPADEETQTDSADNEVAALTWRKLVFVDDTMILLAEAGVDLNETPSTEPSENPDAAAPADTPDTNTTTGPDTSATPDTSTNPDIPVTPDTSTNPDTPVTPDTSTNPDTPTLPAQPTETPSTNPAGPGEGMPQEPSTGQTPSDAVTPPDGEGQPGETVPVIPQPGSTAEEGYYVVVFEYVSGLEEAVPLYQIDRKVPAEEDALEGAKPYDCYNFTGDGAFASGEDELEEGELEDGMEPFMSEIAPDGSFVYAGAGLGQYKLQEVPETEEGYKLLLYNAPTFFRCSGGSDWLERYVFHSLTGDDNESETFDIQVRGVTADEVTPDDVMGADLVYLEAGLGEFLGTGATIHYMTEYGGDMSVDVLFSIVYRAVNDLMPVIADYGIIAASYGLTDSEEQDPDAGLETGDEQTPGTEQTPKLNYQKLVQILLKKNLSAYYQDMESADNMMMNLAATEYPDKIDNNYNYVNRNIYIVNGETLVSEDFYEPFDDEKVSAGFMEVLAALKAENSTLADDDRISEIVSKARAVQYIINYAVGLISDFRDIHVLELQPTDTHSDLKWRHDLDKGYSILYWQKDGSSAYGQQILRSSKVIDIEVDTCSVAEFSGRQSDINDQYQMIFIGLDGQRLNYESKGGKRYTVYNDEELNGRVYSNTGDIATEDGERYEGIDITPQKKEALLDFMKAGYPIVVEDDFFTGQSAKDVGVDEINTELVDSNSQMYSFLRTAVNEYEDYLYTISDVHSSAVFAAQVNIRRPQIYNTDAEENAEGEQTGIIQQIRVDAEGRYRASVAYRIEDDRGEAYSDNIDIRVYLDSNQDGRFAPEEEIYDGFTTDNGEFTIEFETPQKGILPWKLEVSDSGNSYRRDALTGFFEIYYDNPSVIRILQIAAGNNREDMDPSEINEAAKYNLALAYEAADQTMMGHYLKSAEGLTGSDFEIKTMSAARLAEQLVQNEKYLEGFDVLVLGFGPAEDMSAVSGAVNQYIAQGRGVLMSSLAALGDTGRMGIDSSMLGQREVRTYTKLGEEKGSLKYYHYSSLNDGMFGTRSGMSARQINDGSIGHYPFEIGEKGRLAQDVKGGDYVLNLLDNGSENSIADVTAWYCLEDLGTSDSVSAYEISPKDAANNYYVYSRGNVIYIGEDYYAYKYEEAPGVEPSSTADGYMECRLFINALMAAYNVGIKNPKVTIVAGLAADAPEIESICIPFDEQMVEVADGNAGLLDETTDVYFKIEEPNLAFNKNVQISFYYEDDAGGTSIDIGGESVLATPFASQVWTVEANSLVEVGTEFALVPGKVYKIKAPVIPLHNAGRTNADIYIVVQSNFYQFGQERPVTGSDSIVLNRAQLFLLE